MKNSSINPTFKTVFSAFLKEFFPCDEFATAISKCKTYQEIHDTLVDFNARIAAQLGIDTSECDECDDKDNAINVLQNRVEELEEDEVDTSALTDKMKLQCFIKTHAKFSLEHFTKLMES